MGLFSLFKKKEVSKQKETNSNSFEPDVLSSEGLISFVKSNLENPTEENVLKALDALATPDDDLEHLNENGELPWGWHTHNKAFKEKIDSEYSYFLELWLSSRHAAPKTQYEGLKSFVMYLEDAEKLCKEKGECFEWYFYNIIASKEYIQKRKQELHELQANFDDIEKEFEKKVSELSDLDERLIKALETNQGILQSDFVKMFDPIIHKEVKEMLYNLDKEGKLQRTKSGRSYILNYKG